MMRESEAKKIEMEIKETKQDSLVKEIDNVSDELDHVIGNITFGFMGPDEAADWLEHDAGKITETLNKAREYIEDIEEK
jgi:hypothetical protein